MKSKPNTQIHSVRASSREMVRELGLLGDVYGKTFPSNTQCHILLELAGKPEIGVTDLALALRLDKSTLSRVLSGMVRRGLLRAKAAPSDKRRQIFSITAKGRTVLTQVNSYVDRRVGGALKTLSGNERQTVFDGMALYAAALKRSRLQSEIKIRPIRPKDDKAVAKIIRTVMPEFGAGGPGFAIHDPEVDWMSKAFSKPRSSYFVVEQAGRVVGGGGVTPLKNGPPDTCELQKMYLLPEARGGGVGTRLLAQCVEAAKQHGFKQIYLETLNSMRAANRLYSRFGFKPLPKPIGQTGHCGCDRWMTLNLTK